MRKVRVIDSHTGGEPTRVVPEGEIVLEGATMAERRANLDARFTELARGLVREPRGADVWVGVVLTPPVSAGAVCGVVFFTTVGTLGMCGHGTMGVVETLRHLGRIAPGPVRIDTPVGPVDATLREDGKVAIRNVRAYRYRKDVRVELPEGRSAEGDIAWGGNWFFIVKRPWYHGIAVEHASKLTAHAREIMLHLALQGIRGEDGGVIDHVELFTEEGGTNFVLCPGGDYDRSPCGTGTSAKLAGLYADGKLAAGEVYRQTSVTGSVFEGSVEPHPEGGVIPTLVGQAWVTAESTLIFADDDPLREGL